MGKLTGKVAVVTGAGNGIGQAVARLFATEGARLVVNDLGTDIAGNDPDPSVVADVARDLRALGANVVEHALDISTQRGVDSLIQLATETLGPIDVLVNCAGILRERAFLNLDVKDLSAILELHVVGTFRLMQAAAVTMRQHGGGRIVNTTSLAGLQGNTGQSANSAAAAAVVGLTRTAAIEWMRHRIYVNAVAPLAKTRQTANLPLFHKAQGMTPEHVAPAYLFCASDLAGDMSGEVVTIAGARLSRLRITESAGVFAETVTGVFDIEAMQSAWQALES